MKRQWLWAGAALLATTIGCAGTQPCMVIPAQIELAESVRDAARKQLESQLNQKKRWDTAIGQSEQRLVRLVEDRDKLLKEVGTLEEGQK